jgi:hypothetical protein
LAAARVVEAIAVPVGRPFLEDAHEPSLGDVRQDDFLRDIGEAKVVEDKLARDADPDLAAIFLELPRIETAEGRKTEVDAGVTDEVLGMDRLRTVGEVG